MRLFHIPAIAIMLALSSVGAHAQSTNEADPSNQIQALQQTIKDLQDQIKGLQNKPSSSKKAVKQEMEVEREVKSHASSTEKLKIFYKLRRGAQGEDVRVLQKFLATDPAIYPEGLITAFFGSLTESAVKRFQAKIKLEQVGQVGPQTLARINEILSAAGVTGDVPSDLLNSRVKIEIKIKDGKEEVRIEIKCDSSGSGNPCNDDDSDDEDVDDEDEEETEDDSDDEGEDEDEDDN